MGGSEGGRETMGGSDVGVEWTSSIIISCVYCSLALDMPTFCLFPFSPPH